MVVCKFIRMRIRKTSMSAVRAALEGGHGNAVTAHRRFLRQLTGDRGQLAIERANGRILSLRE